MKASTWFSLHMIWNWKEIFQCFSSSGIITHKRALVSTHSVPSLRSTYLAKFLWTFSCIYTKADYTTWSSFSRPTKIRCKNSKENKIQIHFPKISQKGINIIFSILTNSSCWWIKMFISNLKWKKSWNKLFKSQFFYHVSNLVIFLN